MPDSANFELQPPASEEENHSHVSESERPAAQNGAPGEAGEESFGALLSEFEKSHSYRTAGGERQMAGSVLSVAADRVLLDLGLKIEGVLPLTALPPGKTVVPGESFPVLIKGRTEDGYYDVSLLRVRQSTDWASLERAFAEKSILSGTVTATVKGGLTVDIGVRAFLPASRSGVHDAAGMEKLVGQEIRCRILKVDTADEDVVVDRRSVLEEEQRLASEQLFAGLREGDIVSGVVRSLAPYGAFVDLGGIDGLLHVGDLAWHRVSQPADLLTAGQQVDVKVLKVDPEKRRISLGMKQLQPDPWEDAPGKYKLGERVRGTVTRLTDFGAFVELEPGVEGLIHLSEMSWTRKVHKPGDMVKAGETVEAVVLAMNPAERRIGLGLKQALGDPWTSVPERFPVDARVEGTVSGFVAFGAFVQLAEGVEGMVHISEIDAERRLQHPREALHAGQTVKAQVIAVDVEKRQLRLSIKRLIPTDVDEFFAGHKPGDKVTGRVTAVEGGFARVELGEGVSALCPAPEEQPPARESTAAASIDLSQLTSMLQAKWKGPGGRKQRSETPRQQPGPSEALRPGQIRSFRIAGLDSGSKTVELELS